MLPCRCRETSDERLASVAELEGLISGAAPRAAASRVGAKPLGRVWLWWGAWAGGTAVMMALGAAFDLPLSSEWADGTSPAGRALAEWGEWPGYACAAASALLLLIIELGPAGASAAAPPKGGVWLALKASALALIVGFAVHRRTDSAVAACAVALGLPAAFTLALSEARQARLCERLRPCRPLAVHLLLLFLLAGGTVETIKYAWGRARPRMVLAADASAVHGSSFTPADYSHCLKHDPPGEFHCTFTPWYAPQGPRDGLQSFPSGHSFSGWVLLPLALHTRNMAAAPQIAAWLLVAGWGLAVMTSRVKVGAHWLSDVSAGASLTWMWALLLWGRFAPGRRDAQAGGDGRELRTTLETDW